MRSQVVSITLITPHPRFYFPPVDRFIPKNESVVADESVNPDNVIIFPNPVSHGEVLNAKLEGANPQGFNVAVYDITGKVILQKHYSQQEKFSVDLKDLLANGNTVPCASKIIEASRSGHFHNQQHK